LAKSHIDSTLDASANSVELKTLNIQQKNAEDKLNYLLARAKDPSTASNKLDNQIQSTQKELADINKKRLPLLKEENKLVADVGPIKYVADMFFEGDNALDKAVRMVIFIIMLVFDPLAVLLLIAGNISLKQNEKTLSDVVSDINIETTKEESFDEEIQEHDKIEIAKENITSIEEDVVQEETKKKLEPKYDYDAEFAFRERKDGGTF
jgi:biopolymer transport protein ExbB/TolQ